MILRAELSQRKNGIFHRFLSTVNDIRGKISFFYLVYQPLKSMIKMDAGSFVQGKSRVASVDRRL